ncbi:MAG: hypothetical protein JO247_01915 [Chloroflexi bacterium]|nr:hypothetical protein [Chloroflexota bacterium]
MSSPTPSTGIVLLTAEKTIGAVFFLFATGALVFLTRAGARGRRTAAPGPRA